MQTVMTSSAQQDKSAVTAVRGGDAERYRELVERHERRVFAVAWSRLGDAALAEEATQEAFIRGYRRLWLLGDGAKFAGWIASVARNAAINLGLRHRRELNKRERWALENPEIATEGNSTDETDPLYTPETLRQTLAELPDAHRECLVLFYLEGKSGAEAAAVLGISEAALRVRLHRARAAMRERLEEKLEGSLGKLRPAKSLVPAIMAAVLASSSAKAATAGGAGAAIAGALAKIGLTKWLLPFASFFSFIFFLPMLLVSWLFAQMELKNFRDQKGFRARLFRAGINRRIFVLLVAIIAVAVVIPLLMSCLFIIPSNTFLGFSPRPIFLCIAVFSFALLPFLARQLAINHSPYFIAQVCGSLGTGFVCLLVGLSLLPTSMVMVFIIGQSLLTLLFFGQRPNRMDYNLFLRATEGLLKNITVESPAAQSMARCGKGELLAFARFLGSRWLVNNHRWVGGGLRLRLPLPGFSAWWDWTDLMFNWSWKHRSRIQLAWDGKVSAQLCEADQKALSKFHGDAAISKTELETQVAAAVAVAWRCHRESNVAAAELALGQQPEKEVFVTPPAKGGLAKVRWLMAVLLGLVLLSFSGINLPGCREWLDGLKPVNVSEAEVRAFLGGITTNQNPIINNTQRSYPSDPVIALDNCLVLPPTNLFTSNSLRAVREEVFQHTALKPDSEKRWKLSSFQGSWLLHKALEGGWIGWDDVGLKPLDATVYFHQLNTNEWQFMLSHEEAWSWVKSQSFDVWRISDFTLNQLRWLRDVSCLDLVDREKLIQQIASVQVLSGTPSGQPPIHDWRDVRGLFFTPCWPALQDTYFSLAALEILGGLDRIDREACIKGILKRHRGKGYFTSPDSGGYNEYHIDGSARDTIAAFESLRILGALDRVKDLDRWQFRPLRRGVAKNQLTWQDVEAWVCQQRLERFLRERKENPKAPPRSLLEP
jgi:RNA polymerase sigma factor (sigma-70 family)